MMMMMMTSIPFALTAIGTIRGRVSRRELRLSTIEAELASVLDKHHVLDGAPFKSISVVIHLGESYLPPRVWGVDKASGVLEAAVGVPFAEVRRREPDHISFVMKRAALEALIAACERNGRPVDGLLAAMHDLQVSRNGP